MELFTSLPSARSFVTSICGVKRWLSGMTSLYFAPSGTCGRRILMGVQTALRTSRGVNAESRSYARHASTHTRLDRDEFSKNATHGRRVEPAERDARSCGRWRTLHRRIGHRRCHRRGSVGLAVCVPVRLPSMPRVRFQHRLWRVRTLASIVNRCRSVCTLESTCSAGRLLSACSAGSSPASTLDAGRLRESMATAPKRSAAC